MSEEALEKVASKIGEIYTKLTHKGCVDAEEAHSDVETYTNDTVANAAGFNAFNEAFMRGDVEAVMAAMTDDPIFDGPVPMPDGTCLKGRLLVALTWELLIKAGITFSVEESFVTGDRGVVRWVAYREVDGKKMSVRGADIFQLKGGKVAAKLTYSKADSFLGITLPG